MTDQLPIVRAAPEARRATSHWPTGTRGPLAQWPVVIGLAITVSGSLACRDEITGVADDPDPSPASVPLAITGVDVVSMTADRVDTRRTVLIADGRVSAIGDASLPIPDGSVVIDGRGRYLMPALVDMHAHIRVADLASYLDAGIATVRNMWGWPGLPAIIASIERGEIAGPRIISASQGLDQEPIQWPATRVIHDSLDAVAAVGEQVAAGWSAIKVYTRLSRPAYQAIVAEAARRGVPVVGHVPNAVPIEEALAAGQRSIEHLTGYEARVNRSGRVGVGSWLDADPTRYRALAQATAQAGVWNCPTLAIYAELARQHTAGQRATIIEQRRNFVRELERAGAPLLAGSDAGFDVVRSGSSLHDELAELVAAGLTPYRALRAATIDAGRFLGVAGLGTLVPGAPADLLLVRRNVLDDITAAAQIDGLIRAGAWRPHPRPGPAGPVR